MADGEEVLDLLAKHPATARFVCTKIARRLLSDDPNPALVERLSALFLQAADQPDQIAQVVRALVSDPAFAATPPAKLRRPFEFVAALLRATGAEVAAPENAWVWELSRAGWRQHIFPPPTGHPDVATAWSSGVVLLRMTEWALYAQEEWMGWTSTRLTDALPASARTVAEIAGHWGAALTGGPLDPGVLQAAGVDPDWQPETPDERGWVSSGLVAAAALTPAFLYR